MEARAARRPSIQRARPWPETGGAEAPLVQRPVTYRGPEIADRRWLEAARQTVVPARPMPAFSAGRGSPRSGCCNVLRGGADNRRCGTADADREPPRPFATQSKESELVCWRPHRDAVIRTSGDSSSLLPPRLHPRLGTACTLRIGDVVLLFDTFLAYRLRMSGCPTVREKVEQIG
jgi:hypothetical protein